MDLLSITISVSVMIYHSAGVRFNKSVMAVS